MATIDIPDKICSHCGGIRWVTFNKTKTLSSGEKKTYLSYRCAKKNIESGDKWRKNHLEKYKKTAREYVKSRRKIDFEFAEKEREKIRIYGKVHRQERQLYRKKWAKANLEKDRSYYRKSNKIQCINLSDYYVCRIIIGRNKLFKQDIPQEMVEIKRKQLLLTRQIKNYVKNN